MPCTQGGVLEVQVQPALGLTHDISCLEPKSAEKMGVFFLIPFKVHKGRHQALLARPSRRRNKTIDAGHPVLYLGAQKWKPLPLLT